MLKQLTFSYFSDNYIFPPLKIHLQNKHRISPLSCSEEPRFFILKAASLTKLSDLSAKFDTLLISVCYDFLAFRNSAKLLEAYAGIKICFSQKTILTKRHIR